MYIYNFLFQIINQNYLIYFNHFRALWPHCPQETESGMLTLIRRQCVLLKFYDVGQAHLPSSQFPSSQIFPGFPPREAFPLGNGLPRWRQIDAVIVNGRRFLRLRRRLGLGGWPKGGKVPKCQTLSTVIWGLPYRGPFPNFHCVMSGGHNHWHSYIMDSLIFAGNNKRSSGFAGDPAFCQPPLPRPLLLFSRWGHNGNCQQNEWLTWQYARTHTWRSIYTQCTHTTDPLPPAGPRPPIGPLTLPMGKITTPHPFL